MNRKLIVKRYQSGWSGLRLAKKHKCSDTTIYTILDEKGVPRRTQSVAQRRFSDKQEERMCNLYLGGQSTLKIAHQYSCYDACVRRILIRHGIKLRSLSEARKGPTKEEVEFICQSYINGYTADEIATLFVGRIARTTVTRVLKKNNISRRSYHETSKLAHLNGKFDKWKLQGKYTSKQANKFWRHIEQTMKIKFERNKYGKFTYVLEGTEFDAKRGSILYEFDGIYFHTEEHDERMFRRRELAEKYDMEVIFIPASKTLKKTIASLTNWIKQHFRETQDGKINI